MKPEISQRTLHLWAGVLLSLPILIVGLTAIFIAHEDALGLKQVVLEKVYLPGYGAGEMHAAEPRGYLQAADGREWLATKAGLFERSGAALVPVPALQRVEVRAVAQTSHGLFAATKMGLWQEQADGWRKLRDGDYWSIGARADGTLVATGKESMVLESDDAGASWRPAAQLNQALAALPAEQRREPMTLGKLIMDLHTGKALLGKHYEWLWIDLVGLACALLALTGMVLWRRGRRQKLALAEAAGQGPRPGG
jgi:hypothetical protein